MVRKNKSLSRFFFLKLLIIGLPFVLGISGCSSKIDPSELQNRGGLFYRLNSNKLFTGQIISNTLVAGVKKGKFHGKCMTYFDNGQINLMAYYKNGLADGKRTEYYYDGKLLSESICKKDLLEGSFKLYHQNGQVYADSNFKNNKLLGEQRLYADDGSLKLKAVFTMDAIGGPIEAYYEKILVYRRTYDEKGVTVETFNQNGSPQYLAHYKDNSGINSYLDTINRILEQDEVADTILLSLEKSLCFGGAKYLRLESDAQLQGEFIVYYQNGKIEHKGFRKDGTWDGVYEKYSPEGVLLEKHNYSDGLLQGTYELYYKDTGSIYVKANMSNNERNGLYEQYYPNGKLQYSINFVNNSIDGKCEKYNEENIPIVTYTFLNNKLHGEYTDFHENGTPRIVATLNKGVIETTRFFDESGVELTNQNPNIYFDLISSYDLESIYITEEDRFY